MQIVFHTVDAVYLRKESQMYWLTNALRNHSQSPLDGFANMYTPHRQQQSGTGHVESGPAFRTITDVKNDWLFVSYFWHNKAHGTYGTYIFRSHH